MKKVLLTSFILLSATGSLEARNMAQELIDEQYRRLSPGASLDDEEHRGHAEGAHGFGAEGVMGDHMTQEGEGDTISLDDYLTGLQYQDTQSGEEKLNEEVFIIQSVNAGEGPQKIRVNPELLKKITKPEEKEELSWWDEVVEFLEGLVA